MNNFEIEVLEFNSPTNAANGVNEFINDCNDNDIEILETTSHVTGDIDSYSYTFIFKLSI